VIATISLRRDRIDEAFTYIKQARKIADHYDLKLIGPIFLEGIVSMEKDNFKQARDIFRGIIRDRRDYAEAYNVLGLCHYNIGDKEAGIDYIKHAIELKPDLTSAHMSLFKMEVNTNNSSASDLGRYWTKSPKRIFALAIIIIGALTIIPAFQYPDTEVVFNNSSNYSIQQGDQKRDIRESTTSKDISNLNQLRLAIIIGIIVIILWPTIRMIKVGTSDIEVEKVTAIESKEQIYLSWIPIDPVFQSGRALEFH
jgi:tetratricopeptide (TPR) repeat protein